MSRNLKFESLEERNLLAGLVAGSDQPFASAVNLFESDAAVFSASAEPTAASAEYYVGTYYDVNKYWSGDSQLCWAASTSNILAYTNWGFSVFNSGDNPNDLLFDDEYDIYDCFFDNFTDKGSNAYYAIPWFMTGEYGVTGVSGWAQPTGDGGNYFPGISVDSVKTYLHYQTYSDRLIGKMADYLHDGYGVVLALGWYTSSAPTSRSGGHSISVWGYTYNPDLPSTDPNYYTGLIVTNSDDHTTGTTVVSIEWNSQYKMYHYASGVGWIEDFTCLKSVETLEGVSAVGYNGVYDGDSHSITVSGTDSEIDTVIYYYNDAKSLKAPEFTEEGTYTVNVTVVRDNFDAVWSAPVQVVITSAAPEQLETPELSSIVSNGYQSQLISWLPVANTATYEAAWSLDGVTWQSVATVGTSTIISGLTNGAVISYKIRAVGDGQSFSDSDWSEILTKRVVPMDIDGDGFIGPGDSSYLSAAWFATEDDENWNPACDIDGDGFIGPGDLSYLSAAWFKTEDDPDLQFPK